VNQDLLTHPFTLGFACGLILVALALYHLWRARSELRRYKKHLADKMDIEAEAMTKLKRDYEGLKKENENLRVKVSSLNQGVDRNAMRDLEIFARAEKRMFVAAPGFAGAWESAKSAANAELQDEEAGRSLPQRVFGKFFALSPKETATAEKALPEK
jgi:cell division protein FtsB